MAKSRDTAKEQYWRKVIRRFEASGLGVRRFCEQQGLAERRLHWWRRTLRQRDQEQAELPASVRTGEPACGKGDKSLCEKPGRTVRGKAGRPARGGRGGPVRGRGGEGGDSAFLPLGLPFSVGVPIEVVHPRGHVIRVPAAFDPTALGHILARIDASADASGAP